MATTALGDRTTTSWIDWMLPVEWRGSESDLTRKARGLALAASVAAVLCLVAAVHHAREAEYLQASLVAISPGPVLAAVWLLHRTRRIPPAIHWLCAYTTALTLVGVWLAGGMFSVYAGLLAVPVGATAVGGSRIGLFWTAIIVGIIAVIAGQLAETDTDALVGWNAMVGVAIVGSVMVATEAARERTSRRFLEAVAAAETSQRSRTDAEQALAESEALFRLAFARAPSAFTLTVEDTGECLDTNDYFLRLLGREREEVVGRNFVDVGFFGDHDDRERVVRSMVSGENTEIELPFTRADGTEFWLLCYVERFEYRGQRCLLCQGIDITDRKLAGEARERSHREQLRESERLAAVGTLAAGVAHQINNPIGAIAAATEFALMVEPEEGGEAIRHEALETALEEARRCGRIVKSMLKFARDEPTPKWVEDLNATVRRAAELGRAYVEERGGKLEVETWPSDLLSMISPIDIDQMVVNLVRNAAESRDGGAEVKVVTERVGDEIEVSVTDNGRGIDDETRARIYDPFYTTRLEDGGSGLGLSVVHGVVADHGARLDVERAPAGGTRFVVRFPIAEAERD